VAGIVKLDDAGLYLSQRQGSLARRLGRCILWAAPFLMRTLSIAGTAAMFLVGGGIITHGIPFLHHLIEHVAEVLKHAGGIGAFLSAVVPALLNGLCGLIAGMVALLLFRGYQRVRAKVVV